jgi:hypothetical protein
MHSLNLQIVPLQIAESNDGDQKDDDDGDLINGLPREIHCDLVQTLRKHCAEWNLLEIWNYNETAIRNLTRQDIINGINSVKKSPVYNADYPWFLGGKRYNSSGSVVGATSIMNMWFTEWEPAKKEASNKILGLDFKSADPFTMQWEAVMIEKFLDQAEEIQKEGEGFELYFYFDRR